MFETTTSLSSAAPAVEPGKVAASRRSFPLEHEAEFAEIQASAPNASFLTASLGTGLLFHALLIAEREVLGLSPTFFALRGVPVTVALLALLVLPSRMRNQARLLLCLAGWSAIAALTAGVSMADSDALLPLQTGIAALILLCGWGAKLPLRWTGLLCGGMLATDALSLFGAQDGFSTLKFDGLFAPLFALAFTLLNAWVREQEARREFIAIRTAAFTGVDVGQAAEEDRHLDPVTGVGNRVAFDMRLRAAWEHATPRRNSVALLMFSIDDFAQKKRDHGQRYGDMLQVQVAGMLKEGLRRSDDMVARYDIHHFVVMLPGVGTDGATQIAERLRGCVEELVVYSGAERHRATVTVGVASLRAKRSTPRERLLECTTQALEQAKQTGPNTVCVEGRGCLPRMS